RAAARARPPRGTARALRRARARLPPAAAVPPAPCGARVDVRPRPLPALLHAAAEPAQRAARDPVPRRGARRARPRRRRSPKTLAAARRGRPRRARAHAGRLRLGDHGRGPRIPRLVARLAPAPGAPARAHLRGRARALPPLARVHLREDGSGLPVGQLGQPLALLDELPLQGRPGRLAAGERRLQRPAPRAAPPLL